MKKYLVVAPLIASCSSLGDQSDMFRGQDQTNQWQYVGIGNLIKNLNQKRQDSYPLHDAAEKGNIEKVKILLSSGSDVHGLDNLRRSPLSYAVHNRHTDVCKLLCEYKANVDEEDNVGRSLLHWASYKGHLEIVALLLEHGAKVDQKDRLEKTLFIGQCRVAI